jgi:hypothetical protein
MFFLNQNITGQSADPGDFPRKEQQSSKGNDDDPENNKQFPGVLYPVNHDFPVPYQLSVLKGY